MSEERDVMSEENLLNGVGEEGALKKGLDAWKSMMEKNKHPQAASGPIAMVPSDEQKIVPGDSLTKDLPGGDGLIA